MKAVCWNGIHDVRVEMEAHGGPSLDAVYDKVKQTLRLETDRPHVLRETIQACRKGGTVSLAGLYVGFVDKIPMGAAFNKGLTLRMGQTHVQKYMRPLLDRIQRGEIDPSFVVTHRLPLDEAPEAYRLFREKQDGCVKVVLKPLDRLGRRQVPGNRQRGDIMDSENGNLPFYITQKETTMADKITKSIIVDGRPSEVFNLWADVENFPHFMEYVKSVVPTSERTSRWVVEGPLGQDVEWEADITRFEPSRRIGWSTKDRYDDSDVTTSGQVTFTEVGTDQTEVTVTMQYEPPAGAAGEMVAKIFANPEKRVEEDLENFKKFAEGDVGRLPYR